MKITPTCFIGLLLAVQGNLHAQNRLPGNCLDTLAVREMYRDGHVREALHTWENFMAEGARSEIRISRECFLLAEQYMGGLKLVLNKDTATAETYFASLLQLAPNQEMWEFDLPMETQTFWDHFREENGKGLPFDETWKNNWMPPLKYETPKNNVLLKLRKVYHQNRRLFAVSGDDRFKIIQVLNNTEGLNDPAFKLLHVSAEFRLDVNSERILNEISLISPEKSVLVSDENLSTWYNGLAFTMKVQQVTLDRRLKEKKTGKVSESPIILRTEATK